MVRSDHQVVGAGRAAPGFVSRSDREKPLIHDSIHGQKYVQCQFLGKVSDPALHWAMPRVSVQPAPRYLWPTTEDRCPRFLRPFFPEVRWGVCFGLRCAGRVRHLLRGQGGIDGRCPRGQDRTEKAAGRLEVETAPPAGRDPNPQLALGAPCAREPTRAVAATRA